MLIFFPSSIYVYGNTGQAAAFGDGNSSCPPGHPLSVFHGGHEMLPLTSSNSHPPVITSTPHVMEEECSNSVEGRDQPHNDVVEDMPASDTLMSLPVRDETNGLKEGCSLVDHEEVNQKSSTEMV